jgi:hypothetical protein
MVTDHRHFDLIPPDDLDHRFSGIGIVHLAIDFDFAHRLAFVMQPLDRPEKMLSSQHPQCRGAYIAFSSEVHRSNFSIWIFP